MPDVPPWARVAGDVNVGVRRGAWYQVIRLTPEAAWLDLTHRTLSVPRECLEIVTVRPDAWSVVVDDDLGVVPGDAEVLEDDLALRRPPDDDLSGAERVRLRDLAVLIVQPKHE